MTENTKDSNCCLKIPILDKKFNFEAKILFPVKILHALSARTHMIRAQCTQKRRCSTPCHCECQTSANVWTHTLPAPAPRYYWRFHYILLHWTHRVPTHVKCTRRQQRKWDNTHTHHYAFFAFYSGSSKKHNIIYSFAKVEIFVWRIEQANCVLEKVLCRAIADREQSKILRELYYAHVAQWITCACVLTKISVPTFIWRDAAECVAWWPGMRNLAIVRIFAHFWMNWFHF